MFNLLTRKGFVEKEMQTLKRLIRAIDKAVAFIRSEPKKSQQIVARKLDISFEWVNSQPNQRTGLTCYVHHCGLVGNLSNV